MPRRNTRPRTDCPICHRDVAIDTRNADPDANIGGTLVRHNDEHGDLCRGAFEPYRLTAHKPAEKLVDQVEPETDGNAHNNLLNGLAVDYGNVTPDNPLEIGELAQWWRRIAEVQIQMVVPKATEYGATDLRDLGLQILEMAGRQPHDANMPGERNARATEIGIAFYAMGKLARISAAVKEGRSPSYDSWLDLAIYATMACRVHTHGGWPGLPRRLTARKSTVLTDLSDTELAEARAQAEANGLTEANMAKLQAWVEAQRG